MAALLRAPVAMATSLGLRTYAAAATTQAVGVAARTEAMAPPPPAPGANAPHSAPAAPHADCGAAGARKGSSPGVSNYSNADEVGIQRSGMLQRLFH